MKQATYFEARDNGGKIRFESLSESDTVAGAQHLFRTEKTVCEIVEIPCKAKDHSTPRHRH